MTRLLASPRNGLAQRTVDTILGHEWLRRVNGLPHYVEAKVYWRALVAGCACKGGTSRPCRDCVEVENERGTNNEQCDY